MKTIDINIIKWIQNNLRNNVLDYLLYGITQLGDVYIFILLLAILYWTVNKRFAYKFFFTFMVSAGINNAIKVLVARERPYKIDGIESIISDTSGYSFPSGHSQAVAVGFYGLMDEYGKNSRMLRYLLIAILILVPFSRMYLGQHFLTDVLIGVVLGIALAYLLFKLFDLMKDKEHIYPLYLIPVIVLTLILFLGKDYDTYKELYVIGGGYIGFSVGYALEKLYVKHEVNAPLNIKIIKVLIGLVTVAIIYLGLKAIFPKESMLFDGIRYMVVAFHAALGAPYLFIKVFKE
ncbi:MAG: phosphatase PAP2 family protein [Acholeplasma sp.]|nr:phosphatase PAP2 family protein [Acholeplasma sp.]